MRNIQISFVLPVYNVQAYISDCLDSLLNQGVSMDDYEILCVNDGSTDESENIVKEYMEKYKNIHLISQPNQGVSHARNVGFDYASGEYIWFVDPDDYLSVNILPFILRLFEEKKCKLIKVEKDTVTEKEHFNQEYRVLHVGTNIRQTGTVWQYIVEKKSLLENSIRFNEQLSYGEDYLWECLVRYFITEIESIDTPVYHYRLRTGSAMETAGKKKKKHRDDMIRLATEYQKMAEAFCSSDLKFAKHLENRATLASQAAIIDIINIASNMHEVREQVENMRELGLYPYNCNLQKLIPKHSLKATMKNYLEFLLPVQWYVIFSWWILNTKNKLRKIMEG